MHDAIIIGGSYAGLSAGLQLARARKRILVVDRGERRNRFAGESHGFLAQDGRPPQEIAEDARRQLAAYPSVEWIEGLATEAAGGLDAFEVRTDDGQRHGARRLLLAGGVRDILPAIAGLEEQWGAAAMTCPYCHGYELDRGPLAVIATGPMSIHHATVVSEWGPTTFFLNCTPMPDAEHVADLARRGIMLDPTPISGVTGPRGRPVLTLDDGRALSFAGLFVMTSVELTNPLAAQLGCEMTDTPAGRLIKVDFMQQTSVPGVFAAGDCASPMASIALSVGSGAMAGAALHRSLIFSPTQAKAA